MEVSLIANKALDNYFKELHKIGYVKDNITYNILVLSFIYILISEYTGYLTEEDYRIINHTIDCIGNSCLIPLKESIIALDSKLNYIENTPVKITENEIIRLTENDLMHLGFN